MTGSLDSRQVLAAIEETTPGTLNSSVYAAAQAKHLIRNASIDFDFPVYTRDIKRSTLTPLPGLAGRKQARITFGIELTGEGSSGVPPYDIFLRACGLTRESLEKITIGAVTGGPFRHGETITQATTGATAKVFMDTYTGTTTLYVYDLVGSENNSNVWTGGTSSASATPSSVGSAAGYGWRPVDFPTTTVTYATTPSPDVAVSDIFQGGTSGAIGIVEEVDTTGKVIKARIQNAKMFSAGETLTRITPDTDSLGAASSIAQEDMPTLTMALYEDGNRWTIAGARGTVSMTANNGEPAMLNFTFTGAFADDSDAAMLTGISHGLKVPPVMLGATALLGTEGSTPSYTARFQSVSLDLGNDLQYRESASATLGVIETMIVGRSGSGSVDPEADLEVSYPFVGNFADNAVGSLQFTIGTANGNKFIHQVPGLRTNGVGTGNRNGVRTRELAFEMTGGSMANVSNSANERNDWLIAYITA
jgi:hypothetical protein